MLGLSGFCLPTAPALGATRQHNRSCPRVSCSAQAGHPQATSRRQLLESLGLAAGVAWLHPGLAQAAGAELMLRITLVSTATTVQIVQK